MHRTYDIDDLLRAYHSTPRGSTGRLIKLQGLEELDGYNPSNIIPDGGVPIAYVRAEGRHAELASWSVPFRQRALDHWEIDHDLPKFQFEDPFLATIHGELVVGGVRIVSTLHDEVTWETVFLRGSSLLDLQEFAVSPPCMKDVRLLELDDGRIGVFTRPWGTESERALIGYTEIEQLDDLTTSVMEDASRLGTQPVSGQWWGANAVYDLGDGTIGVLGHMARWKDGVRHYYAVAFTFDRHRRAITRGPRIIADRASFPPYPARADDLEDVVFPAWIDRVQGLLYCGLSDTAIGVMALADPFIPDGEGR